MVLGNQMKKREILSFEERRLRHFSIVLIVLLFLWSTFLLPVQVLGNNKSVSLRSNIFSPTIDRSDMSVPSTDEYKLLIIALEEFMDALEPLKRFKDATDRPTLLISLEDIYNDFQGADEAEQVKKAIAHYESTNGIQYVMLVGDCNKLPVRYTYMKIHDTSENIVGIETDDDKIIAGIRFQPTDLYYADLYYSGTKTFCSWDNDGDGLYDEKYYDFAGGDWYEPPPYNVDNVDVEPDVAVGRIPASTTNEVENYVNKIIDYEVSAPGSVSDDWFNKALFISGIDGGMWNPNIEINQLNEMADLLDTLGFETVKLYDSDYGGDEELTPANINARLNAGAGFVNIHCHGLRTGWDNGYGTGSMNGLDNDGRLPIIYSMSCLTGAYAPLPEHNEKYHSVTGENHTFDYDWPVPVTSFVAPVRPDPIQKGTDCLAILENFLVHDLNGAIACIGAANLAGIGNTELLNDAFFTGYMFILQAAFGDDNQLYRDKTAYEGLLGDIWNDAIGIYCEHTDITRTPNRNQLCVLHLFGDPSLFVGGVPNQQWAVGTEDILHWDGTQWVPYSTLYPHPMRSISMVSPTDGWIACQDGRLMRWDGFQWNDYQLDFPLGVNLYSVDMLGRNDGWAVGVLGVLLHWDGNHWVQYTHYPPSTLHCVDLLSPWNGWAVGESGLILHWNGTIWEEWESPTSEDLYSICVLSEDEAWAVGDLETIIRWDGDSWIIVSNSKTKGERALRSVNLYKHPGGGTVGGAVGDVGTILYCSDGTWSSIPSPTSVDLLAISLVPPEWGIGGWAVGRSGIILKGSHTFSWSNSYNPLGTEATPQDTLYDVWWGPRNYPPIAELDDAPLYTGTPTSPMTFDAFASYDPDGDTLEYFWDFGDGVMGNGENPSHTYDIGNYNLTLYVHDGESWDAVTKPVIVAMEVPAPGFSWEIIMIAMPAALILTLYHRQRRRRKTS